MDKHDSQYNLFFGENFPSRKYFLPVTSGKTLLYIKVNLVNINPQSEKRLSVAYLGMETHFLKKVLLPYTKIVLKIPQ